MTRDVPMHIAEGHAGRWYLWFAWYPVMLDDPAGKYAFFRWVLRRTFYFAPWFCVNSTEEFAAVSLRRPSPPEQHP